MYSYAFYELGDHHDAEDATERTFLLALGRSAGSRSVRARSTARAPPRSGSGCSRSPATSWPTCAARRRRRPEAPLDAAATLAAPLDTEAARDAATEAAAAWPAVGRLPADRRRALVLRFVEEMSTAEIAGVLGRSEGAVRVLIHRACAAVARDLGERT